MPRPASAAPPQHRPAALRQRGSSRPGRPARPAPAPWPPDRGGTGAGRSPSSPVRSSPASRPAPTARAGTLPVPPSPARSVQPAAHSPSAGRCRPAFCPAPSPVRGAVRAARRRRPPRGRGCQAVLPASPTRCGPCRCPPDAPARPGSPAARRLPPHGRPLCLNHALKSTYPFLPLPVVQKSFFLQKRNAPAQSGLPCLRCACVLFR